jgi:hypothetical protein
MGEGVLADLYAYWLDRAAGRPMLSRADIDVFEMKRWLGYLMLVEVIEGGADFRYRLYGSNVALLFGRDLTGQTTGSLSVHARDVVAAEYRKVVETRQPHYVRHRRSLVRGKGEIAKLILPLGDGRDVHMLLAAMYRAEMLRSAA